MMIMILFRPGARVVISAVFAASILANLERIWTETAMDGICVVDDNYIYFKRQVEPWLTGSLHVIAPCGVVLVVSLLIICKLIGKRAPWSSPWFLPFTSSSCS